MANEQNLRPHKMTSDEARENQKKSVESHKRKKAERETIVKTIKKTLEKEVTDEKQLQTITKAGLPVGHHPTYQDFLVASVLLRSIQKGHMEDLQRLTDLVGETKGGMSAEDKSPETSKLFTALQESDNDVTEVIEKAESSS